MNPDGNLLSPLQNSADFKNNLPRVFNEPYTAAEILVLEKVWRPFLDQIQAEILDAGYRPENYPGMDKTVIISRILATFKRNNHEV